MTKPPLLSIVLAAGKGTRMRSARPKVLHEIAGQSMLGHVLATARQAAAGPLAVVVGPDMAAVEAAARRAAPDAQLFVQPDQRGTADAVLAARPALAAHQGDVLVLYADTPLIRAETLQRLRDALDGGAGIAVLGFEAADPTGYGRLLLDDAGRLAAIREEKDASEAERAVRSCNSGVMAFRLPDLLGVLGRITDENAKRELYLTDAIAIARGDGQPAGVVICAEEEVLGVNSRDQLAEAEAIYQRRRRLEVMRDGATLIAPETVWLSFDTRIGRDVVVEPNVFFGPGVEVEDDVEIKANCHLEGARICSGARVGPFARLRPGAVLGANCHIGNFVEVKNSQLAEASKANHLSYVGDATVGRNVNIGAGTIVANYDGANKHRTVIGDDAHTGSNSVLVAPITVGAGATVGAGSTVTREVPAGKLTVARAKQVTVPGWQRPARKK